MVYEVPDAHEADLELIEMTTPDALEVNFSFITEGYFIKIKINGTVVEKPLMIKKEGIIEQVKNLTIK